MNIYFASSNKNKVDELNSLLDVFVKQIDVDITEIQGTSHEIAIDKLKRVCSNNLNKYIIIDDCGLRIEALNGFPGPYCKDFLNIGLECLENLVSKIGRKAEAYSIIGLGIIKEEGFFEYHLFEGTILGTIVPLKSSSRFFDDVFMPDDLKIVYSKMTLEEKKKYHHRGVACKKLNDFLFDMIIKANNKI